jgi:hypothetical protein
VVDESVVDELVYLDADGTEHCMPRDIWKAGWHRLPGKLEHP